MRVVTLAVGLGQHPAAAGQGQQQGFARQQGLPQAQELAALQSTSVTCCMVSSQTMAAGPQCLPLRLLLLLLLLVDAPQHRAQQ
jgi:hypothetical protein